MYAIRSYYDFRNAIIIMTSNVGARDIVEPKRVGFGVSDLEAAKSYRNNFV